GACLEARVPTPSRAQDNMRLHPNHLVDRMPPTGYVSAATTKCSRPKPEEAIRMLASCPNCHARPADTLVHYDELVNRRYQRTSRQSARGRMTVRSYSSVSDRGDATLCSVCAARYTRMVKMRELGLTLANRGFLALLGCMLLAVFAYNLSAG